MTRDEKLLEVLYDESDRAIEKGFIGYHGEIGILRDLMKGLISEDSSEIEESDFAEAWIDDRETLYMDYGV